MDAVQKANSGHPGTAMALAPLGYTLFERFLRVNPADPHWPDRDRFVLSAGHACMLQYSLLHLTGFDLSARGPAAVPPVGLAHARPPRARPHARASRSRPDRSDRASPTPSAWRWPSASSPSASTAPAHEVVDHHVYVICSDGDMMEGISQEAASIAGHFALGKLVVCYDDNHITIDGTTALSFDGENHTARMEAEGWHVQRVEDSEDLDALRRRDRGRARRSRAPLLHRDPLAHRLPRARTRSTPPRRTASPLGEDEVRATKEVMGFDPDRHFWVDERVYEHMSLRERGARAAARVASERFDLLARGVPGAWPRTGIAPGPGACATAGASRCRPSPRARRSPRARPGRRRWPPSPTTRRR